MLRLFSFCIPLPSSTPARRGTSSKGKVFAPALRSYDSIGNAPAAPPATGRICPHRKSVTGRVRAAAGFVQILRTAPKRYHQKGIKKSPAYWRDFLSLCWHYLSSRQVTLQVLSAQMSLTSVFGMGTGGPSSQSIPTISDGCYPSLSMSKPSFRF